MAYILTIALLGFGLVLVFYLAHKYGASSSDFEALILICGTKIWIFKMQTPFMGVIIESKEIVDLMTFMWRSIWDNLPKVVKDEHL